MNAQDIRSVAVIGAGLMGHGIAIEFTLAGYDVRLHSRSEESLHRARGMIRDSLERLEDLGNISKQEAESVPDRVRMSTDLGEVAGDADLVIESIYEDIDAKTELFGQLDELCPDRTILASNTSSFLPSKLAAATTRPDKGHQRALSQSAVPRAARRGCPDGGDFGGNDRRRNGIC